MTTAAGWTHRVRRTLPAPPAAVFAALTRSKELCRWFAEDALVEPREGGLFAFWGRHTYGAPAAADDRQVVTRIEPGRKIAFRWPFDGLDSEVVLALEVARDDTPAATDLVLEHRFAEHRRGIEDLVDDLWRLSLGNLDAHLRGGEGIVLPDFADPSPEIRLSIFIDAPPDRVFAALIEPEMLNRWIASVARVEPRVGGHYSFGWNYKNGDREVCAGPTQILDLVPNERLVIDWPDWRGDPRKPMTRVVWLLEQADSGTRVTLVHGEFPRAIEISDYPFGWGSFLRRLKDCIEEKSA